MGKKETKNEEPINIEEARRVVKELHETLETHELILTEYQNLQKIKDWLADKMVLGFEVTVISIKREGSGPHKKGLPRERATFTTMPEIGGVPPDAVPMVELIASVGRYVDEVVENIENDFDTRDNLTEGIRDLIKILKLNPDRVLNR